VVHPHEVTPDELNPAAAAACCFAALRSNQLCRISFHRTADICLGSGHCHHARRCAWRSKTLPISQYPSIAPPAIAISVIYPGASAATVTKHLSVQVIEQQLSGIDHLLYFSSESDKRRQHDHHAQFRAGKPIPTSPRFRCRNKLQLATAVVAAGSTACKGIRRRERSDAQFPFSSSGFSRQDDSPVQRRTSGDFSIASNVQDPLSRHGGGSATIRLFGAQYSMRIWLDPAQTQQLLPDAGWTSPTPRFKRKT